MKFRIGQTTFELYFSKDKRSYSVRLAEPDDSPHWDYEDEELARDLTADVRGCRSLEEALYSLGLGCHSGSAYMSRFDVREVADPS